MSKYGTRTPMSYNPAADDEARNRGRDREPGGSGSRSRSRSRSRSQSSRSQSSRHDDDVAEVAREDFIDHGYHDMRSDRSNRSLRYGTVNASAIEKRQDIGKKMATLNGVVSKSEHLLNRRGLLPLIDTYMKQVDFIAEKLYASPVDVQVFIDDPIITKFIQFHASPTEFANVMVNALQKLISLDARGRFGDVNYKDENRSYSRFVQSTVDYMLRENRDYDMGEDRENKFRH